MNGTNLYLCYTDDGSGEKCKTGMARFSRNYSDLRESPKQDYLTWPAGAHRRHVTAMWLRKPSNSSQELRPRSPDLSQKTDSPRKKLKLPLPCASALTARLRRFAASSVVCSRQPPQQNQSWVLERSHKSDYLNPRGSAELVHGYPSA